MNDFDVLLKYLNQVPKNDNVRVIETNKSTKESQFVSFKENDQIKTNDIVDDLKLNSTFDNPNFSFDVNKFQDIVKRKLIEKINIIKTYDYPYLSINQILQCPRKTYFEVKKYDVNIDSITFFPLIDLISEIESCIIQYIQNIFSFKEINKIIVSKKYMIRDQVDAIIDDNIIMVKFCDFENLMSIRKEEKDKATILIDILNNDYEYHIQNFCCIYFSKDLKEVISFNDKYSKEYSDKLLSNYNDLKKSIDINEIPREHEKDLKICHVCFFNKFCQKDIVVNQKNRHGVFLM